MTRKGKSRTGKLRSYFSKKLLALVFTIATTLLAAFIWHLYSERPVIYSKVIVPENYTPDQGPLQASILVCNRGGNDIAVDMLIIIVSLIDWPSNWTSRVYDITTLRISAVLIGGQNDFAVFPISIYVHHNPETFDMTMSVRVFFSITSLFWEYHSMSPSGFNYEKRGDGAYHLRLPSE